MPLVLVRVLQRNQEVKVLVAQSCPTLWDPMNCNPSGSSVHRLLQARILERVAIPFSRGFPNTGIKPGSPALQADSLPSEPPGKLKNTGVDLPNPGIKPLSLISPTLAGGFFTTHHLGSPSCTYHSRMTVFDRTVTPDEGTACQVLFSSVLFGSMYSLGLSYQLFSYLGYFWYHKAN